MKKLQSIILIDDDEITNSLNQMTIEELGVTDNILSFSDGEKAIEYLKGRTAQDEDSNELLVVDLNMPGFDGEDFVNQFNKIPLLDRDKIKIAIYSALLPGKQYQYLKNLGVDDFIEKPLTADKVAKLIQRLGLCVAG